MKTITFWDLLSETGDMYYDKISIPEIQRDYVQGRKTEIIRENRKEFVKQLVDASKGRNNMSLNFVYGETIKVSNESIFIPIDGQQRLTTLFLFHLYVATKKGIYESDFDKNSWDTFKKFEYNTRITSNRFFRKLVGNTWDDSGIYKILSDNEDDIDVAIRNSSWFSYTWGNDTTIDSCIEMLKEIDNEFKNNSDTLDWEKIWKNLINEKCVTFMFLELTGKQYGDSSELYIRMNSRGRQLTDYENFKAELYEKCSDFIDDGFKKKIDDVWYSTLWEICKQNLSINNTAFDSSDISQSTDNLILYIFRSVFTNMLCESKYAKYWDEDGLKPESIKNDMRYLSRYNDKIHNHEDELLLVHDGIGVDFTCMFSNLMDFLSWLYGEKNFNAVDDDFDKLKAYIYEKILNSANGGFTYQSRFLLYIITKFASLVPSTYFDSCSICGLKEILRVFINLTSNIGFDNPATFQYGITVINELAEYNPQYILCIQNMVIDGSTRKVFEDIIDRRTFRTNEAREEALKLNLIYNEKCSQRNEWKKVIYAIDQFLGYSYDCFEKKGVEYFGGQIYFIFHMVGMVGINDINDVIDISDVNTTHLDKFKKYCEAIFTIFSEIVYDSEKDKMFHRGLLLFGNYGRKNKKKKDRYDWIYPARFDTSHKNNDWRGSLRFPAHLTENPDDWSSTYKNLDAFLKDFLEKGTDYSVKDYERYITNKISNIEKPSDFDSLLPEEKVIYKLLTNNEFFDGMAPIKNNKNSNYVYQYDGHGGYFIIDNKNDKQVKYIF